MTVGSSTISPVSSVRDLGIFVDSNLVMHTHVCQTVSRCFAALRQVRSIRHLISATVFQSLVTALVLSRLDHGNGTLIGADRPADPPYPLPSVCAECCGTADISSSPI